MHKVVNYGSALQAWALQETLLKLGFDVRLIDYLYPNSFYFSHVPINKGRNTFSLDKISIEKLLKYLKKKLFYKKAKQYELFHTFWDSNFLLTRPYSSPEELRVDVPYADYYITGSDQVWNPNTMFGDPSYFLDFCPEECCKISYAASFGTNIISKEFEIPYSKFLKMYNSLGVREKSGIDIIESLTAEKATLVCDPTLLLTKDDYACLANQSTITIDKPYLLAYILDYAFNPYPVIQDVIDKVSKRLGLHVVYLLCGNTNGFKIGSTTISAAGPNEFVHLFNNASFVVTSSFHGTVFSLIHEKQFLAILPSHKSDSRIESLLTDLSLLNRTIKADDTFKIGVIDDEVDYNVVNTKITCLRNHSIDYLLSSLN